MTLTEIIVSTLFEFMFKLLFGEDIWQRMLIKPVKITAMSQSLSLPQAVIISEYISLLNIIKRLATRNPNLSWQSAELLLLFLIVIKIQKLEVRLDTLQRFFLAEKNNQSKLLFQTNWAHVKNNSSMKFGLSRPKWLLLICSCDNLSISAFPVQKSLVCFILNIKLVLQQHMSEAISKMRFCFCLLMVRMK